MDRRPDPPADTVRHNVRSCEHHENRKKDVQRSKHRRQVEHRHQADQPANDNDENADVRPVGPEHDLSDDAVEACAIARRQQVDRNSDADEINQRRRVTTRNHVKITDP